MKNQNIQREKVSGEAGNTNDRTCALEQPNVVEDRFRVLIEKNLDGILLLDEQTTFIYVSPSIQTISGYEPAELLYKQGLDYVHPDDKAPVSASLSTLLKNPEGTVTSRFRFLKKDGQWQWVEAQVMNLLHEPSVKALVANFRDISETIKREENFQSAQELLHSLMEYVVTPILVTSIDGTVRTASEAWKQLFNLEHEEVRGKNLQHLVPLNAAEDALASNKEIAETKKVLSYDRSVVTPAGRKFLNIVKFPLLDKQGSVEAV